MHPLTIQSSNALRALAVTASILAAYAAFLLAERIERTEDFWHRRVWLTAAATVLALSMWSMHFFGALEDPAPAAAVYQGGLVVLCLLAAISACWVGLRLVVWRPAQWGRLLLGSLVITGGLAAVHLLGERALRSAYVAEVRPVSLAIAAVTGWLLVTLGVWTVFSHRSGNRRTEWRRMGGSALVGAGITVGQSLASRAFVLRSVSLPVSVWGGISGSVVGETALLVTIGLVLLVTLGTAAVDKQRFRELSQLHQALAASQQALLRSEAQLREANGLLSELSIRDSLTGLYNRRRFDEVFDTEWRRSLRSQRPLALLMIDVDCFKSLNDHQGHLRGDECLREIARILEDQPRRKHDMVARFGGEEFVVLLPGSDAAGALGIAENIRRSVEGQQMPHPDSKVGPWVTTSIGVCSRTPRLGETSGDILYDADMALYLAKQLGRNRVELREAVVVEV